MLEWMSLSAFYFAMYFIAPLSLSFLRSLTAISTLTGLPLKSTTFVFGGDGIITSKPIRRPTRGSQVDLVGLVSVFCDPETYPSEPVLESLGSSCVAAVGIHPRKASEFTPQKLQQFARIVQNPKVVALGKIGIDHGIPAEAWPIQ